MRFTFRNKIHFLYLLVIVWTGVMPVPMTAFDANPWAVGFELGPTLPVENFNQLADNDKAMGLNLEYMNLMFLGMRMSYVNNSFKNNPLIGNQKFEVDTFAVDAVIAYQFPQYIRVFALVGPAYFSAQNQERIGLRSDGKDIGWGAGAGFEFYPIPGWGLRLQSKYYSAELTDNEPRLSWVNTTVGLVFRF